MSPPIVFEEMFASQKILRGQVWKVRDIFKDVKFRERSHLMAKDRPYLVVSAQEFLDEEIIQAYPITSKASIDLLHSEETDLVFRSPSGWYSRIIMSQLTSIDRQFFMNYMFTVPDNLMAEVERATAKRLGLFSTLDYINQLMEKSKTILESLEKQAENSENIRLGKLDIPKKGSSFWGKHQIAPEFIEEEDMPQYGHLAKPCQKTTQSTPVTPVISHDGIKSLPIKNTNTPAQTVNPSSTPIPPAEKKEESDSKTKEESKPIEKKEPVTPLGSAIQHSQPIKQSSVVPAKPAPIPVAQMPSKANKQEKTPEVIETQKSDIVDDLIDKAADASSDELDNLLDKAIESLANGIMTSNEESTMELEESDKKSDKKDDKKKKKKNKIQWNHDLAQQYIDYYENREYGMITEKFGIADSSVMMRKYYYLKGKFGICTNGLKNTTRRQECNKMRK